MIKNVEKIVMCMLAFFCVFLISYKNVYISNFIYVVWIVILVLIKKLLVIKNMDQVLLFALYVTWVIFDVLLVNRLNINARNVVVILFNLQYGILLLDKTIEIKVFVKCFYKFTLVLALYIIAVFIKEKCYLDISAVLGWNRDWGYKYIIGFPNSLCIPIGMALFISYKENKSIVGKILLILTTLIIPSRTGWVTTALIVMWFTAKNFGIPKTLKIIKISVILGGVLLLVIILCYPQVWGKIGTRIFSHNDRKDIFNMSIKYWINNPIMGYGGNSLDEIVKIIGNFSIYGKAWPHTHNWILEVLLRYGTVGLVLFVLFIQKIYAKIADSDCKAMLIILLVIALFQTYMQDFVFILCIAVLVQWDLMQTKDELMRKK